MIEELLHVALTAASSIIILFFLAKIMGNRQVSQLSTFDYINGITIGSISAEMATSLENDFLKPLVAMVVYTFLTVIISILTCKSIKLRRFCTGKPMILFSDGKIYQKNLLKAKIDVNDFLMQCRDKGYFNLADLQTAVLEFNGRVSFLPKSSKRPVTPSDMNISPSVEKPLANVIIDGKVMPDNLKATGNNEKWLLKELSAQGIKNVYDVFLATCDCDNNLSVYVKVNARSSDTFFE